MDRRQILSSALALSVVTVGSPRAQTQRRKPIRILSIDGGGIRGVAAARSLTLIHKALRASGKPGVADCFDLYAGTSTGSLIAAGLAANQQLGGRFADPASIEAIYRERGREIFRPFRNLEPTAFRAKYDKNGLRDTLQSVFGPVRVADLNKNFICTYFNLKGSRQSVVVRGGPAFGSSASPLLLSEAVQASSSAPTYFDPANINSELLGADGGLFANNPSAIALVEARRWFGDVPMTLVSIGCGSTKPQYQTNLGTWGIYEWASPRNGVPILDAVMRGQSDSVDQLLESLLNRDGQPRSYFRFQFDMSSLPAGLGRLDDVKKRNLDALVNLAEQRMLMDDSQRSLAEFVRSV